MSTATYDTSVLHSNPLPDGLVRVELNAEPEVLYEGDQPSRVRPCIRYWDQELFLNGARMGEVLLVTRCRDLTRPKAAEFWEVVYRPKAFA